MRQRHSSRVCVTKQGSGTLTVNVPWEVVGSQAVTNTQWWILGGTLLCCVFTATNLSAQEPFAPPRLLDTGESFLPQDLRTPIMKLGDSRGRAFIKKASATESFCSPQPNTFLIDTSNGPTLSLDPQGLLALLAKQALAIHNGAPLFFVKWPSSSDHALAQNLPACIFPGQEPFDTH